MNATIMAGKYVAYFDESGDHGLTSIDPGFPAFVLCGCVYSIDDYLKIEAPAFSAMKFDTFGHDAVVMHSREIRKRLGPFKILQDDKVRKKFSGEIASFFQTSKATLIAAAINKDRHKNQYAHPIDPYDIALIFCLERLYGYLSDRNEADTTMACVFEQRGEAEDRRLAKTFRTACAGANQWGKKFPFEVVFANKQQNMPGLQIADLAAYPIARHVIDPDAANPAFKVISPLFRRSASGQIMGWGLKIFP